MRSSRSQMQPFARHWPSGRPSVTALLMAASVAAFCAEWSLFFLDREDTAWPVRLVDWLGLHSNAFSSGHWWQFGTFVLLHPHPGHLLINMFVLLFAGREVEPIIGLKHFAVLYALGNFLGGLAQFGAMMLGWAPIGPAAALVGVSAGVAAVLAAYATILPELELMVLPAFVVPLRVRAKMLGWATLLGAALLWVAQAGPQYGPVAILAGSAVGWIYAKQLGFGNPLALERYLFDRRQHAVRLERMPAEQFIREELDPILEKIARQGPRSLSRAERKLLEKGRLKLAARDTVKTG